MRPSILAMCVLVAALAADRCFSQQAASREYALDDAVGSLAFYPGCIYRGYVAPESSYVPLKTGASSGKAPAGTGFVIRRTKRGFVGIPILFPIAGVPHWTQFSRFESFCRLHKIELNCTRRRRNSQ